MNTTSKKQQQNKSSETLNSVNNDNFNFEVWAREVRRQLLAALHKS
jgi:hypothetical protein